MISTQADYYEAIVTTASDYYPFGWSMPNRKLNTENYQFGFNGQETDTEWNGGQSVNFLFRVLDPRIGRFLSVDPLAPSYPWYTPYQFAGNTPIWAIDVEGAEPDHTNDGSESTSDGSGGNVSKTGNAIEYSGESEVTVRADKMTTNEAAQRKMTRGGLSKQDKVGKLNSRTLMNAFADARANGEGGDFDETFRSPNKIFGSITSFVEDEKKCSFPVWKTRTKYTQNY